MKKLTISISEELYNAIRQYLKESGEGHAKEDIRYFVEGEANNSIAMNYSSIADIMQANELNK